MSPQDIDDFKLLKIESSQISDDVRRGQKPVSCESLILFYFYVSHFSFLIF